MRDRPLTPDPWPRWAVVLAGLFIIASPFLAVAAVGAWP